MICSIRVVMPYGLRPAMPANQDQIIIDYFELVPADSKIIINCTSAYTQVL